VPADEGVGCDEGGDALGKRPVVRGELSADLEVRDVRALEPNRELFARLLVAGRRPRNERVLLHEADSDEAPEPQVQDGDDLAQHVVRVAATLDHPLDLGERFDVRARAHASRSSPSNERTSARTASGTGQGRRSGRSTSTIVWVAVTMSASSSTR